MHHRWDFQSIYMTPNDVWEEISNFKLFAYACSPQNPTSSLTQSDDMSPSMLKLSVESPELVPVVHVARESSPSTPLERYYLIGQNCASALPYRHNTVTRLKTWSIPQISRKRLRLFRSCFLRPSCVSRLFHRLVPAAKLCPFGILCCVGSSVGGRL